MLRFVVNRSTTERISSLFENIPAVSDRNLKFQDLKPYLTGEFALFYSKNGEQTFATKLKSNTELNQLLDSHNIIQTKTRGGYILLSNTTKSIGINSVSLRLMPKLSLPWRLWLGDILSDGSRGDIYLKDKSLEIHTPQKNPVAEPINFFSENTIAFLSTPMLPIESSDPIIQSFYPLLSSLIPNGFESMYTQLFGKNPKIILTSDKEGIGFFFVADSNHLENKTLENILKSIGAINTPKIETKDLVDHTTYQEIIADPSLVSLEQVTLHGTQMYRIAMKNQTILAGIAGNSQIILTNREEILKAFKEASPIKADDMCGAKQIYLSTSAFSKPAENNSNDRQSTIIQELSQHFTKIGIILKKNSTIIHLCP